MTNTWRNAPKVVVVRSDGTVETDPLQDVWEKCTFKAPRRMTPEQKRGWKKIMKLNKLLRSLM